MLPFDQTSIIQFAPQNSNPSLFPCVYYDVYGFTSADGGGGRNGAPAFRVHVGVRVEVHQERRRAV